MHVRCLTGVTASLQSLRSHCAEGMGHGEIHRFSFCDPQILKIKWGMGRMNGMVGLHPTTPFSHLQQSSNPGCDGNNCMNSLPGRALLSQGHHCRHLELRAPPAQPISSTLLQARSLSGINQFSSTDCRKSCQCKSVWNVIKSSGN